MVLQLIEKFVNQKVFRVVGVVVVFSSGFVVVGLFVLLLKCAC